MPHIHRFGRFELRPHERVLLHDGEPRPLGARALDVLIALVQAEGALITKEQLLQSAWPGLVVEEANVHVQVSHLRKLLGARAIATVASLGYRFALPREGRPGLGAPHNLPAERTRFIGREALLDEAAQRLAQTRLLTLTGIGGSGKTRLALRLGAELLGRYPDGVWFVDLAALGDGAQVALPLARALGVTLAADRAVPELLAARVQGSTLLVVLDNCEHLLDEVAQLTSLLLASSADLRVLATSREALGLAGESVLPVGPLALPPSNASPARLAEAEAVRLFIERAREAQPGLGSDLENLDTAAAICRRVDGIPLAIELAAAQLRVLAPSQLLALLEERFQLLVGGRRALPRQQTLGAVVRWAWDRLDASGQRLLAALAVCSGGCDLATAAALQGEGLAPVALVDGLLRLSALSLLRVERADASLDGAQTRYTLLETVRQFALEQLQSNDAAALRQRHCAHFLALAETEERSLMQVPEPGRVIEHLDAERDNLLQALAWCRQTGDSRSELRFVVALRHYWGARGLLPLGHGLSQSALARAPAQPYTLERCAALAATAQLAQMMGQHEEARGLIEQQVAAARVLGDDEWLGAGLGLLSDQQRRQGDLEGATRSLHEACEASRRCGDERRLSNALGSLATVAKMAGRMEEAWQGCLDQLALRRSQPHRYGVGVAVLNCASMAVERGQVEVARAYLAEGLQISRQVCSRHLTQALVTIAAEWAALRDQHALATRLGAADRAQREVLQMPLDADCTQQRQAYQQEASIALGAARCDAEVEAGSSATHEQTLIWVDTALGAAAAVVPGG